MKPLEGRKRRFGDRRDGFLVRNLDPMGKLIPFIMKSKSDSWVLFEDRIDITHTQDFLHTMRKTDLPGLTLYHIIFAAVVRPGLFPGAGAEPLYQGQQYLCPQ